MPTAAMEKRMTSEDGARSCPFCKELIKADAIKCKYCASAVAPEKAPHGGICPYCKEEIHLEAIKCKHCKSSLEASSQTDCGCNDNGSMTELAGRGSSTSAGELRISTSASLRTRRLASNLIIVGGPADPTDPWHCQGFYECTNVCVPWLGCVPVCVWKCLVV
jgi:Double zinc ribbon